MFVVDIDWFVMMSGSGCSGWLVMLCNVWVYGCDVYVDFIIERVFFFCLVLIMLMFELLLLKFFFGLYCFIVWCEEVGGVGVVEFWV